MCLHDIFTHLSSTYHTCFRPRENSCHADPCRYVHSVSIIRILGWNYGSPEIAYTYKYSSWLVNPTPLGGVFWTGKKKPTNAAISVHVFLHEVCRSMLQPSMWNSFHTTLIYILFWHTIWWLFICFFIACSTMYEVLLHDLFCDILYSDFSSVFIMIQFTITFYMIFLWHTILWLFIWWMEIEQALLVLIP